MSRPTNAEVKEKPTLPLHSDTVEISPLKVSVKTARYIHLKDKLVDLWNDLYDTLEEDYGLGSSDTFDRDILPHLNKLSEEIEAYLIVSINENHKGNII